MEAFTVEIGNNFLLAITVGIPSIVSAIAAAIAARRTRELKPNGGGSMKDQMSEVHRSIEKRNPHAETEKGTEDGNSET